MNAESQIFEVYTLISSLVRAMVSNPDDIQVSSMLSPTGSTIIQIRAVREQDIGKLIGQQGRTARSLRIIVQAIAKEQGQRYQLDIDETTIDGTIGP